MSEAMEIQMGIEGRRNEFTPTHIAATPDCVKCGREMELIGGIQTGMYVRAEWICACGHKEFLSYIPAKII